MFSMPVLALKLSDQRNGVSELHGQVSRKMWHFLWPEFGWTKCRSRILPTACIPAPGWRAACGCCSIATWEPTGCSISMTRIFGLRLIISRTRSCGLFAGISSASWSMFANERARMQWLNGQVHPVQVIAWGVLMEPYSLTIGFARRFATYKRGNLILRDFDRLLRIINNPYMPVQIVFAGKAHPADEPGKTDYSASLPRGQRFPHGRTVGLSRRL